MIIPAIFQSGDLVAVVRSIRRVGFRKTIEKIRWALGNRGLLHKDEHLKLSQIPVPHLWSEVDLESRKTILPKDDSIQSLKVYVNYLPQFHEISENNRWWGDGFTEWTKVKAASPLFDGHYQPHIPINEDYYDLSDIKVMQRQWELARKFGVSGFSVYFYWFAGKRLLEKPLDQLVSNPLVEFPFYINWANEPWTKKWDGLENQVLMKQEYPLGYELEFIKDVAHYMKSPNYIRIDGRPVLAVHRPEHLPNPAKAAGIWRDYLEKEGLGNPYLIGVESFQKLNLKEIGFDTISSFAPNNFGLQKFNHSGHKRGNSYKYDDLVATRQYCDNPDSPFIRSVAVGWDNTPRRGAESTIFHGGTPTKFRNWLFDMSCKTILDNSESNKRIVMINAWNEWAEGCHLESDEKNGYSYLHAVRDVQEILQTEWFLNLKFQFEQSEYEKLFTPIPQKTYSAPKVVIVTHDLNKNGAQILALNLCIEWMRAGIKVEVISCGEGPLKEVYQDKLGVTPIIFDDLKPNEVRNVLENFDNEGVRNVFVNSVASGAIIQELQKFKFNITSLVHELPETISHYKLELGTKDIMENSHTVIYPNSFVQNEIEQEFGKNRNSLVLPQGLFNVSKFENSTFVELHNLMEKIGISLLDKVVLGVGYGDYRKGVDRFIEAAQENPGYFFIWIGNVDSNDARVNSAFEKPPRNFKQLDFLENLNPVYDLADVYYLASRQDPYPSSVLEALYKGLPVIYHDKTTGLQEDLESLGDFALIDKINFSESLSKSLLQNTFVNQLQRRNFVRENRNFRHYAHALLKVAELHVPKISVLVPSYNYGRYLDVRLREIESQTLAPYEILIYDDFSDDNSPSIIERFSLITSSKITYVRSHENSGTPFIAWERLLPKVVGDFIWIAEVDDVSSVFFLSRLVQAFDENSILVASSPVIIDIKNEILAGSYKEYLKDIVQWDLDLPYKKLQPNELLETISSMNPFFSVNSCLINVHLAKKTWNTCLPDITKYTTAGDWFFYINLYAQGDFICISEILTAHRRHSLSAIGKTEVGRQKAEYFKVYDYIDMKYEKSIEIESLRSKVLFKYFGSDENDN
jgi:glycosyltransferase involved in cell wall biosynthesis